MIFWLAALAGFILMLWLLSEILLPFVAGAAIAYLLIFFVIPLFTLPFGLLLVTTHNIWKWELPLFLTIAGWGMTIKSAAYLLTPGLADRALSKKMANGGSASLLTRP